jgi:hypothetical protein
MYEAEALTSHFSFHFHAREGKEWREGGREEREKKREPL